MRTKAILTVYTLILAVSDVNGLLLRKGWYRSKTKGPKMALANVETLDESVVPNGSYLRVNGRIPVLFKSSVRNLSKVTILKFSFCGIEKLLPGAFENLPRMSTLALLDNEIEHVPAGVFNNLNVTTLYLQRNQISSIDTKAFDDMPKLYKIKLNYNRITVWNPDWFLNSPSLTEVLFRRNELETIPSKAFKNLKGSHKSNGTYVVDTKIYLSKNSISSIAADALDGLDELGQLWLDRNELTEIDQRVFGKITQISTLFLSRNKLRSLPDKMFKSLTSNIDILDLAGNNNMTCISYGIVSMVSLTNIQNIHKLNCTCVHKLMEQLAEEEKNNEIKTDCQRYE